ncbi:tyrosine-type recombinase/integrase [Pseudoduganella sp. LjRoot289]|uniref:tyrosine-type recombinase/integrase n=1 Tax=Pseudoduganella sp. LjRoot289 TaxID=3342314 RepID=UPI003ECC4DEB
MIDLEPLTGQARRVDLNPYRELPEDALTDARTDSEIAREFIGHGELSAKSRTNTQKELYRFLTWCREEAGKSLRQLQVSDLNAYKEFLREPPADWVSATKWPRTDPRYRPFSGPLSDASRRQAMIAVKGLMAFAEQTGYLRRDPGAMVKHVKTRGASRITRYLSQDAIALALSTVAGRAAETPAELRRRARDRFLLLAYAHTGARLNEIVSAAMGDIYSEGAGRWWLDLLGKGNKPRRVPVPPELLDGYRAYRQAYGMLPQTSRADRMPLVLSSRGSVGARLTDEAASNALKAVFSAAGGAAAALGDIDMAATLRQASAHWLRHSMLTNHANNGVQLKTLQDTAGHASIATTAAYLHKSDNQRHDEIMASLDGRTVA